MRRGGRVSEARHRKQMFRVLREMRAKTLAPCMEPSSVCACVRVRAACVCLCARACVPAGLGAQVHASTGIANHTVEVGKGKMRHEAHDGKTPRQTYADANLKLLVQIKANVMP